MHRLLKNRWLVLTPHASQRIADLAQGDIVFNAIDKQRQQVVLAARLAFQAVEKLGDAVRIPAAAELRQAERELAARPPIRPAWPGPATAWW